jgi:hypothetical protein
VFGIDRTPNRVHDVFVAGQRRSDVEQAFINAVESLGFEVRIESDLGADRSVDFVISSPEGPTILVELKSASLVTADSAPRMLGPSHGTVDDVLSVVVADRITADARQGLSRAGQSWLDLRGHLRLVGRGLFVDADVPALLSPSPKPSGLRGRVGMELAAMLLLDPTGRVGVRAAATTLARAPSSISETFTALRAADLVDADRRPAVPELFWELAGHWDSTVRDVAALPGTGRPRDNELLHLGVDDVESTVGWAMTDTVAAAAYGAPVSMRADHPPDFYVPDQSVLRRAVQLLGPAVAPSARACRVRVAPVPLVCTRRVAGSGRGEAAWPLANPLFVALDLAQDPGRGREILDAWTPDGPWARVW